MITTTNLSFLEYAATQVYMQESVHLSVLRECTRDYYYQYTHNFISADISTIIDIQDHNY